MITNTGSKIRGVSTVHRFTHIMYPGENWNRSSECCNFISRLIIRIKILYFRIYLEIKSNLVVSL